MQAHAFAERKNQKSNQSILVLNEKEREIFGGMILNAKVVTGYKPYRFLWLQFSFIGPALKLIQLAKFQTTTIKKSFSFKLICS